MKFPMLSFLNVCVYTSWLVNDDQNTLIMQPAYIYTTFFFSAMVGGGYNCKT